jgi:hypothetical protein
LFVRTPVCVVPLRTVLRASVCRKFAPWLLSPPCVTLIDAGVVPEVVTAFATGSVTLVAPAIRTTPAISRRARFCEPPPSGIRGESP